MARVFLGMPTYDARAYVSTLLALYVTSSREHKTVACSHDASLLSFNMNSLYAMALNDRDKNGAQWFAMLHSDIEPDHWWIDTLIEEAEAHEADIMTAIVPIKDERGVTSTGIAHPDHPWSPYCRLTLAQRNHDDMPVTFDVNACVDALARLPEGLRLEAPRTQLLVNTGACVVRLDRPWADELIFTTGERILKIEGKWCTKVESEDWRFGKLAASLGAKVMATKAVNVKHHGTGHFESDMTWGKPIDCDCLEEHAYATILAVENENK